MPLNVQALQSKLVSGLRGELFLGSVAGSIDSYKQADNWLQVIGRVALAAAAAAVAAAAASANGGDYDDGWGRVVVALTKSVKGWPLNSACGALADARHTAELAAHKAEAQAAAAQATEAAAQKRADELERAKNDLPMPRGRTNGLERAVVCVNAVEHAQNENVSAGACIWVWWRWRESE
eukprot:511213-Pelagomonas_calceolata.AAC.4